MRRVLLTTLLCAVATLGAQTRIPAPKDHFGFELGDDYQLATYRQIADYWRSLDRASDRLVLHEMGKTAEGRPQVMAIVTAPANHRHLARYKEIARRLALAEGLTDTEARALAKDGKAVVWIDGGLHASEVLGAQQLAQMVYEMVSRTDEETLRFLDQCILLFVHANPDGNDLVADWYLRNPVPERRTLANLPRLYQKYIGHDNNRDFFMSTQPETENINRVLYHEWFPQILYNHHQSGPAGTVVWSSPQRDPYNYNLDPSVILGLQALGTHLHQRLASEGKPGATMAAGGAYDGWWNGGIRNTGNFHNIIAILTETIGSPTPMRIPLVMQRQIPTRDLPYPIAPQPWRFRQSIEYSMSFNRAVIDYAARNREPLLFDIYRMGQRSIRRGSEDTWTPAPTRMQATVERMGGGQAAGANPGPQTGVNAGQQAGVNAADRDAATWAELHKPELRDPRGYIIPADQPDFPTATKFVNALREVNVTVHRATRDFDAAGKRYPVNSFIVLTAQAFRPHVMDMFEPQDHPNVIPYPGAPPTPPYDNAGWTLAYQMGVRFDRILDGFTGPFEKITEWNVKPTPGRVTTTPAGEGYAVSREANDAVRAVNRLLAAGDDVFDQVTDLKGTFFVGARPGTLGRVQAIATELGISFGAAKLSMTGAKLRAPRIGLWDQYGGSMESGWTRWLLEQFEFPFDRVFAPQLDAGGLNAKYDVLIFVDGGIPGTASTGGRGARGAGAGPDPQDVPAEYRAQVGRVTADRTLPQLKSFVESGGTVIALGSSAMNLGGHLALPVENHLVENGQPLPRAKYFVPGSVLSARVDTSHPIAAGMPERTDFFFDNSPVFRVRAGAAGVRAIAAFDSPTPLRSGWAWGQKYLDGGVLALEARVGSGRVLLFGPEILQRAQPHGTFKLLFNGIYASVVPPK